MVADLKFAWWLQSINTYFEDFFNPDFNYLNSKQPYKYKYGFTRWIPGCISFICCGIPMHDSLKNFFQQIANSLQMSGRPEKGFWTQISNETEKNSAKKKCSADMDKLFLKESHFLEIPNIQIIS